MLSCLGCFQTEWCAQVFFTAQNRARRGHRNSELTRDHFRLGSLAGTRRAQKNKSPFHLVAVKENGHAANHDDSDADIEPHERATARGFSARIGSTIERAATDAALSQKTVVMPLDQMRFHLPHRIEHHAYDNQQTRPTEELRRNLRYVHALAEKTRQDRDDR